ncbi:MAG: S1 RNA-binding domain-containing protein, partial [Deltaproteobacteria bacterium]|nr:S1 RNA-binding domain-containing protein [Deltaproteobacteria bacterium]
FEKGDTVEAVVLKIDKQNEKFSLGIKQLESNPWEDILKKYKVGSEITGPITSVADFGVFVRLEEGVDGLVYSSELAEERIETPAEHFKVGEAVTALVVKVDANDQKISLSIRAVADKAARAALKEQAQQQSASQTTTLGDLLAEKLQAQNVEESDD